MTENVQSHQKLFMVFNPNAAFGRAKKLLPVIQKSFAEKQIETEVELTEYPRHATEIIKQLDFSKYNGIVVAGGDGTLFETVNGYFQNSSAERIPVGVVPVGTGNAFVRDLDLKTNDYADAIDIISLNKPQATDVAQFSSNGDTNYFLNILGMGFITDVQKIAVKLKVFGNF